jgi:hypothetical protein
VSNRDHARAQKKGAYQWRNNPGRGESFILYRWSESFLALRDGTKHRVFAGWRDIAFVYKAHKGRRWVYQSVRTGKTQGFHDVRTAMRMAVLLTQLETPNA